jgi:hypothetical protein
LLQSSLLLGTADTFAILLVIVVIVASDNIVEVRVNGLLETHQR